MRDDFRPFVNSMRNRGIHVRPGSDPDLLVVSHERINFPDSGNSFWVALKDGAWLISTYLPECWRVPAGYDLTNLCADCLDSSRTAIYRVPAELVARHGLSAVTEDEFNALFPPDPDDAEAE